MPAQPNQSLADGVALLGLLCSRGDAIGSRELARQMDWEPTRANRLLGTLRDLGLAEQDADRRYRPGPGVHLLAAQCLQGSGLLQAALTEIRALRQPGLGFALGVLWRGQVCYLLHAAAGRPIEEGLRRTRLYPAQESSIGMALEAYGNRKKSGAAIRAQGFAVQRNEDGQTGSVALVIPAARPGSPPLAALAVMANYAQYQPADLAALLRPAVAAIALALHS